MDFSLHQITNPADITRKAPNIVCLPGRSAKIINPIIVDPIICKYKNGAITDDGAILKACVNNKFVAMEPIAIIPSKNHWKSFGITGATLSKSNNSPARIINVIIITAVTAI